VSGSGGVARRTPVYFLTKGVGAAPLVGVPVAAALLACWLLLDPRTPDLAAQLYRVGLFSRHGFSVWDENWYAGHDLPGYSLLFPPLASLLGLRLVAALSVLASVALFERITVHIYGGCVRWATVVFAVAAVGDVWSGRLTFALGVTLALAAVLAFIRGRTVTTIALAVLCAAASPVAGLLLALAGLTEALWHRRLRGVLLLAVPAGALACVLALLFGEGGAEPYPALSFAATAVVILVFVAALPRASGFLRLGALVYLAACVLCLLVPSPMGSNVERYGVLLAAPLLACALLAAGRRPADGPDRARGRWRAGAAPVAGIAVAVIGVWVVWGPVRETLEVAGNESTSASYYLPVERFLAARTSAPVRLEVPLTRSHWEAAELAPTVMLARGWEKQLDERFDHVLLAPGLTAAAYQRWLGDQGVDYVALPDTPLDPSSAQEGRLVRHGLPYLKLVLVSRHWRVYAVRSPVPLAFGPGRLESMDHDSFALRAFEPGRFLVRVHFTRYLTVAAGAGCVSEAPGGWTAVEARAPGTMIVDARFSLARALGIGSSCHAGA
jgi:hypothetical protein